MNQIECKDARPLIGAYTDGELSEAQAGPLRKHLLSCHECRNSAQAIKGSKRWFPRATATETEGLVPAGFAARVARRAFEGDTGEHAAPARVGVGGATLVVERGDSRRQLGFLLEVTGIAAAVLVAFSVAFRMREMPTDQVLRADEAMTVQQIKDQLEELNELDETTGPASGQGAAGH